MLLTTAPSLLLEVKGSVRPSSSPAKRASFCRVSRLNFPFSKAWTSPGSAAEPASSVIAPSGPREMFETVRRPEVSFSIAPPETGTRPTYDSRSSSTRKVRLVPSGDQRKGPETGRSSPAVRTLAAPTAEGTTASLLRL